MDEHQDLFRQHLERYKELRKHRPQRDQELFHNYLDGYQELFVGIWTAIYNSVSEKINLIKTVITVVWNAIHTAISTVLNAI